MPIRYEVKQGDCIPSIAFRHGFFPDTIWDHPENAELKRKRQDRNVLQPGDQVFVPDLRAKREPAQTDQTHLFRRKAVPKLLRVQFLHPDGSPIRRAPLTVAIDDEPAKSVTDDYGWFERYISPAARKASVQFDDGPSVTLQLGFLNPIETTEGVLQRLWNLRFYRGPISPEMTAEAVDALRTFQASRKLPPAGAVDDATRQALLQLSND